MELTRAEISEVRIIVNRKLHKFFDDVVGRDKVSRVIKQAHYHRQQKDAEVSDEELDATLQSIIEEYDIREEDH